MTQGSPPDHGYPVGEPDSDAITVWREAQSQRLIRFIQVDMWLTLSSSVYVLIIYWFFVRRGYLLATVGVVVTSGAVMYVALVAARRRATDAAVACLAAANWFAVVAAVVLAAPVWPILVLAAVLPVTVAASYVGAEHFRWYLLGSVVIAGASTVLGLFTDATSMAEEVPGWAIDSVLSVFVPLLTAMVGLLALQNFTQIRATFADLADTHSRLQVQSDALVASRTRMVAATDRERRRIERDLHDGTQQQFVAMGLKLGAIKRAIDIDSDRAKGLIDDLRSELKDAQAQLRDLTLGIYPPTLTQHGLTAALERAVDQVSSPMVTAIDDVGRFDPAIEASVYFICVEALHNADKHAGADATVTLSLRCDDRSGLRLEVVDDGAGYDPLTIDHRSGTQNMEDRIAAVNGTLSVTSSPGHGTSVVGQIPIETTDLRGSSVEPTRPAL